MRIHNCHTHVFANTIVPANFVPLGLIRQLTRRRLSWKLGWLPNPFRRLSQGSEGQRPVTKLRPKSVTCCHERLCQRVAFLVRKPLMCLELRHNPLGCR